MLATELAKNELPEGTTEIYGIVVDEFIIDVPFQLKEIGFIAAKDENGMLDTQVLDVALSCNARGMDVVLEVPFGFDMPAQDIFITAMNSGIAISLLPPENGSEDDFKVYTETLKEYAEMWLTQQNVAKMVYPISGYFQYMINEVFNFKTPSITTDKYIQSKFVDNFPLEKMDEIKDDLKEKIITVMGGHLEFEKFAHSIAFGLANRIKQVTS